MNVTVKTNGKLNLRKVPGLIQTIALEATKNVASETRCPVHGEYAHVEKDGKDLKLVGCCDELLKTVYAKMK
jgi:hypothetical protein